MSSGTMRITYVKSVDGYREDQAQTIRSLGFSRLHQTVERPDTPDVRGMVNKVIHLVVVETDEETDKA
jgi:large subunit ribosomal protein L30